MRIAVAATLLVLAGCSCGDDDDDDQAPADAGEADVATASDAGLDAAVDAALDAAPGPACACADEGEEDCAACFANQNRCCVNDEGFAAQVDAIGAACADDDACRVCCNECAAMSCDEIYAHHACEEDRAVDNGDSLELLFALADGALTSEALGQDAIAAQLRDPELLVFWDHIVSCALPEDDEIVVDLGDETVTLPGGLGLAPEWKDGPCEEACQEWMTACFLARLNAWGVPVKLQFGGPTPVLADDGLPTAFVVQEGAFFGNIFENRAHVYACRGDGYDPFWMTLRRCAQNTQECGVTVVGDCGRTVGRTGAATHQHVCDDEVDDVYPACWSRESDFDADTHPAVAHQYTRPITTFLPQTSFGREPVGGVCPE